MNNATMYYNRTFALPPTHAVVVKQRTVPVATYVYDGGPAGSGVLDIARGTQLRVKHW